MTYITFTTDTPKKEFDKTLNKIALNMFDYLFTVEIDGKKEIQSHSNGDISKKILMTKDKNGLLNDKRLNKVTAILNSMLEEKEVNYRVSSPDISKYKIGDNVTLKFVDKDGNSKKISVKEVSKKTDDKKTDGKKNTSNTSNTSKKSDDKKTDDKKEVKESITIESVINFLNSLNNNDFVDLLHKLNEEKKNIVFDKKLSK